MLLVPSPPKMTVQQALEVMPDNLPDGAWMGILCELTGLDEGDVAAELERLGLAEED